MRYFVGHTLQGEVGTWHTSLTNDIALKHGTWRIQDLCPSHVTLFSEFEIDNIAAVEDAIEVILQNRNTGNYSICEFDRFEDRVVFAKIDPDSQVISLVQKLRESLEQIPGIPKDKHLVWKPHATVAFRLPSEDINKIWNYVKTLEKPNFTSRLDNITIFKFDNSKWIIETMFQADEHKVEN